MIDVLPLFPKLNSSLISLLSGLDQRQWDMSTLCKKWTVKDIAAHLLDGALRRLSVGSDSFQPELENPESNPGLLAYLNNLNADWVNAYRRVSPQILLEQLALAQEQLHQYFFNLDPNGKAIFPVSWAGEASSTNHFDMAREYTERWLHQQQIRQALGVVSILEPDLYHPFLEICMQALPYHYKTFESSEGNVVQIEIVGDAGGVWSIIRKSNTWEFTDSPVEICSQVYIDQNIAWMLFSKGIEINQASQYWQIIGDQNMGRHVLSMTSFMV